MIRGVVARFERPLNIAAGNKERKSGEFRRRQDSDPGFGFEREGYDRISLRSAWRKRKITPIAPVSAECRVTAGGNGEPRTAGTAARVGAWCRRDRRVRVRTADPHRRTHSDGPRYTGNGRLCIERRQQGSVR